MSKAPRNILTPGEPDAVMDEAAVPTMAERLAALEAENAALRAATKPALPSVVFMPETPNGRARMAASEYASMTVDELTHAIDAGKAQELPPSSNALCRDGYYCSRARISA